MERGRVHVHKHIHHEAVISRWMDGRIDIPCIIHAHTYGFLSASTCLSSVFSPLILSNLHKHGTDVLEREAISGLLILRKRNRR